MPVMDTDLEVMIPGEVFVISNLIQISQPPDQEAEPSRIHEALIFQMVSLLGTCTPTGMSSL
jgi:hypothetical protein